MKSYTILLLCWIAVIAAEEASKTESKNPTGVVTGILDGTGGDSSDTGNDGSKGKVNVASTGEDSGDVTVEEGETSTAIIPDGTTKQKTIFYTEAWLKMFSEKQLANQAKWILADKQPDDGTFQTRLYPVQWWSTSFIPCLTHDEAVTEGYLKLYFYFNGFNYQRQQYPLTYPVLLSVDKRPKPTPAPETPGSENGPKSNNKKRRRRRRKPKVCLTRYTSRFYLPLPLTKWAPIAQDKTIKSFKMSEVVYVREYSGNYTSAYCNEQAGILALDLSRNKISTLDTYWICAKYEAPEGQTEQRYEVWMKHRLEE